MTRVAIGDISLNVESAGQGEPLILLHGFTGSVTTWDAQVDEFAKHFRTVAIDLVGHGLSDSSPELTHYKMHQCVADLRALLDKLGIESAHWLGYSMGGRTALQFAVAYPERVTRLVLEGATPGIADAAERSARVADDEALAEFIEREGIAAFTERWTRQPLFATQERLPAEVRQRLYQQRLRNSPVGLANSLRGMGTGAQRPVWDRLSSVTCPTLLVVGAEDAKFLALARAMAAGMPRAKIAVIEGVGHAAHLENPATFNRAVIDFLLAQDGDLQQALTERPSLAP